MSLQIVECPRDAMQGWPHAIDTATKVSYLNQLLEVGFHTLDCGSFVSPKAIPQMADTKSVIPQLKLENSNTKLLVIVANTRGAAEAVQFESISYLGFPFSISPVFQQRNTNSSIEESLERVKEIQELCISHNKELVIYMSMAFGNPYGDDYNEDILMGWTEKIIAEGIKTVSLADTIGVASPQQISTAVNSLISSYTNTNIGVHLHAAENNFESKLSAAWHAGCRRFDGALKGIGGCPMAQDDLVGNMATEKMINWFNHTGIDTGVKEEQLFLSIRQANTVFI